MSVLLNARPEEKKPLPHRGALFHRRRAASGGGPQGDGRGGVRGHPSLWAHRDLRPRGRQRLEGRVERARPGDAGDLKARQGVRYHALEALDVIDPDTMEPVPADGRTMGEVMFRGNVVMKGYLKNKPATDKAFAGGWFHSGDLGVKHPDGYVQLRDRSKDIIISGAKTFHRSRSRTRCSTIRAFSSPRSWRGRTRNGARALRLCRDEARPCGDRRRAGRMVPSAPRPLQMPAYDRVRRDPEDLDRQGAEIRLARTGEDAGPSQRPEFMRDDAWPRHCRALLVSAAFVGRASFSRTRRAGARARSPPRKTLEEARAIARLSSQRRRAAESTIAALALVRHRVGRARILT